MAIANVSLDTVTRQLVLTIDGVLISASDILVERYIFDGEEFLRFSYSIESTNTNGMKERRQFYLPSLEELAASAHSGLNKQGFASKIIHDDEKAKADVIDFLQHNRKQP